MRLPKQLPVMLVTMASMKSLVANVGEADIEEAAGDGEFRGRGGAQGQLSRRGDGDSRGRGGFRGNRGDGEFRGRGRGRGPRGGAEAGVPACSPCLNHDSVGPRRLSGCMALSVRLCASCSAEMLRLQYISDKTRHLGGLMARPAHQQIYASVLLSPHQQTPTLSSFSQPPPHADFPSRTGARVPSRSPSASITLIGTGITARRRTSNDDALSGFSSMRMERTLPAYSAPEWFRRVLQGFHALVLALNQSVAVNFEVSSSRVSHRAFIAERSSLTHVTVVREATIALHCVSQHRLLRHSSLGRRSPVSCLVTKLASTCSFSRIKSFSAAIAMDRQTFERPSPRLLQDAVVLATHQPCASHLADIAAGCCQI
ncbi:hypothetical protein MRB53_040752 [Persea americana]|nr:hypothetical protein MRB53_040752 [Persea americana]